MWHTAPNFSLNGGVHSGDSYQRSEEFSIGVVIGRLGMGAPYRFGLITGTQTPMTESLPEGQRVQRPNISLKDAIPVVHSIAPNMQLPASIILNQNGDRLCWKWSESRAYSANSAYKIMISGGKINWRYKVLWKCNAPMNPKVFVYLLLRGKLLTHEVLLRCSV